MKLLNYTTSFFAVVLLFVISIWAGIFYYAMLDEIYDSIDDGLDNRKGLIIQKAAVDSTVFRKNNFDEGDYAIKEISGQYAEGFRDLYGDTLMYMQNEKDFEPVRLLRTVFKQNDKYYQMEVITSMVEEDDLIAELFYALLWLYLGLVASILILNNYLLKRIWRPFYYLLDQLKNFKLEQPNEFLVKKTNIDEFLLLNKTVQKLLKSNIDSYSSQKNFIENASHELQTPLAISINKLEALAETDNLTEQQFKLVASTLDNLERLTRLNRSLLLLSRIENKQFLKERQISINGLLKRICDDFYDQLTYNNIALNIKEEASVVLKMNQELAAILFTNFIKNAIIHNHKDGLINIYIDSSCIRIENSGTASGLEEKTLFTRFNKQQYSETSTGLGLSIIKAIADLYSFTIFYSYSNRHVFSLYFS